MPEMRVVALRGANTVTENGGKRLNTTPHELRIVR